MSPFFPSGEKGKKARGFAARSAHYKCAGVPIVPVDRVDQPGHPTSIAEFVFPPSGGFVQNQHNKQDVHAVSKQCLRQLMELDVVR